jgi:antitoxin component HigA of HigAB toxin-antitoxin module
VPPSVLPSPAQKHGLARTPFNSALPALPNEIPSAGGAVEYLNKRRALAIRPIREELVRRLNKQV